MEVFRVGVGQWPEPQEKIVKVSAVEWKSIVLRGSFHQWSVFERVAQPKRAIMKKIVAQPGVSHASLLGNRLQRRMRVDHSHGHEESVVRGSVHSHAPVVVGHIFHQPIDGVICVRALVGAFRVARIVNCSQHHELAL